MTQNNDFTGGSSANAGSHFGAVASNDAVVFLEQVGAECFRVAERYNSYFDYSKGEGRISAGWFKDGGVGFVLTSGDKPLVNLMQMKLQFDAQQGYVLTLAPPATSGHDEPAGPETEQVYAATPEGKRAAVRNVRDIITKYFGGITDRATGYDPLGVLKQVEDDCLTTAQYFNRPYDFINNVADHISAGKHKGGGVGFSLIQSRKSLVWRMCMQVHFDAQDGYVLTLAPLQDRAHVVPAGPETIQSYPATPEGKSKIISDVRGILNQHFRGMDGTTFSASPTGPAPTR